MREILCAVNEHRLLARDRRVFSPSSKDCH
jgi:hypothetical protein